MHKALAIQSLMGQRDMQDLQLQQGRHDYQKQLAIDRAMQGATSDDDLYERLRGVDPKLAIGLQHERFKADKDKYESMKSGVELASQAASSFLALPPEQQAIKYPQLVQQLNQFGFKGDLEPWDAQKLVPGLQWIAAKGLSPEKGIDRMDLSGNGRPPTVPQSTSPAANALMPPPESMFSQDVTKGLEQTSAAMPIVKDMQSKVAAALQDNEAYNNQTGPKDRWGVPFSDTPETQVGLKASGSIQNPVPVPTGALDAGQQGANTGFNGNLISAQSPSASPAATALGAGQPTQTAPVEVTGTPGPETVNSLLEQAKAQRALGMPANLNKAHQLEDAADKLDKRSMEQQKLDTERFKPVSEVAGAYFDPKRGQYMMDGKEISAAKLQAIQLANRKAAAINIGIGDGALGIGKAAQTKVDEGLLDTTSRIAGLNRISAMYKPEYQQIGSRLSNAWTGIKSSLGVNVNQSDKQKLAEFYAYKRNAITQVNQYIQATTGAAVGIQEAQRLMQAVPNPGSSWYDGDNPIEFKAKLDDTLQQLKMAEARLVYIKRNGMSTSADNLEAQIPLNQMPSIINKRGAELEEQLSKNKNISKEDLPRIVRRQLAQEFGLSAD
jgi:hypothetical protein